MTRAKFVPVAGERKPGEEPKFRRVEVSWRYHFHKLVRENYAVKRQGEGGRTSYRTQEYVLETAFILLEALRFELGLKIVKPRNFDPRHALAWARWLNALYRDNKRQPATLAGYATTVRHLLRWAEKPELVQIFDGELDARAVSRELVADRDKSWEGNNVSFDEAFAKAWRVEPWVAMVLVAQEAFGLRRREAVQLHPLRDIDLERSAIYIRAGAKGGRPRTIPIDNHWLQLLAERLIKFVQIRNVDMARDPLKEASLTAPALSLAQALRRYASVMAAIGYTRKNAGVTGHGLRAGYVCRRLIELGVNPVVRGGDGVHPDAARDELAHRLVTESVGHSRRSVLGAYSGSPHAVARVEAMRTLRVRGWLLPGHDPTSVKENLRRREAFIQNPEAFARWMAAQAAPTQDETGPQRGGVVPAERP